MLGLTTLTASAPRPSLRKLRNACIAVALATMALASTAGVALAWDPAAFSGADEQLLFSLTNQDRASAGLNALVNDSYLHGKAEWRAQDMGDRNYFSHAIPPSNSMVFSYMQSDGYCFTYAGENIALSTFDDSVATTKIEIKFMNSASHRANILGTWVRMGIGAYKAADGRKLYAVLFSLPCGAPTPKPTPAPVVTPRPTLPPTPTPTPTPALPSASPTQPPTPNPGVSGGPSAAESKMPSPTDSGSSPAPEQATTLRVHEKTSSQGPIESFFNALFGGIFGS
jgi:uncharacterized protein YkwD